MRPQLASPVAQKMRGTNSLKVTLKLFQEAQMGLLKKKEATFFSLGEQLTDCRSAGGRSAGAIGRHRVGRRPPGAGAPGHFGGLAWSAWPDFIQLTPPRLARPLLPPKPVPSSSGVTEGSPGLCPRRCLWSTDLVCDHGPWASCPSSLSLTCSVSKAETLLYLLRPGKSLTMPSSL